MDRRHGRTSGWIYTFSTKNVLDLRSYCISRILFSIKNYFPGILSQSKHSSTRRSGDQSRSVANNTNRGTISLPAVKALIQNADGNVEKSSIISELTDEHKGKHVVQKKPVKMKEGEGMYIDDVTGVKLERTKGNAYKVLSGPLIGEVVMWELDDQYYYTEDEEYTQTKVELGEKTERMVEESKAEEVVFIDPTEFPLREDLEEYRNIGSIENLIVILKEKMVDESLKSFQKLRAGDTLERVMSLSKSAAIEWPAVKMSGKTIDNGNHRLLVAIIRGEKLKVVK